MWKIVMLIYLAIGLVIMLSPLGQRLIKKEAGDVGTKEYPVWKVVGFFSFLYIASLFLWPLFLPEIFNMKKTLMDELNKNPYFSEQKSTFELMDRMTEESEDSDLIRGLSNCIDTSGTLKTVLTLFSDGRIDKHITLMGETYLVTLGVGFSTPYPSLKEALSDTGILYVSSAINKIESSELSAEEIVININSDVDEGYQLEINHETWVMGSSGKFEKEK